MNAKIVPVTHPDPWVDLLRAYVTEAVVALDAHGIAIHRSWLDPRGPRDATIVWRDTGNPASAPREWALVWDEETGWRLGDLVSGRQGVRTVLSRPRSLGGGVLPAAEEVAHRVVADVVEVTQEYRSCHDLHDGLDFTLGARRMPLLGRG